MSVLSSGYEQFLNNLAIDKNCKKYKNNDFLGSGITENKCYQQIKLRVDCCLEM